MKIIKLVKSEKHQAFVAEHRIIVQKDADMAEIKGRFQIGDVGAQRIEILQIVRNGGFLGLKKVVHIVLQGIGNLFRLSKTCLNLLDQLPVSHQDCIHKLAVGGIGI